MFISHPNLALRTPEHDNNGQTLDRWSLKEEEEDYVMKPAAWPEMSPYYDDCRCLFAKRERPTCPSALYTAHTAAVRRCQLSQLGALYPVCCTKVERATMVAGEQPDSSAVVTTERAPDRHKPRRYDYPAHTHHNQGVPSSSQPARQRRQNEQNTSANLYVSCSRTNSDDIMH